MSCVGLNEIVSFIFRLSMKNFRSELEYYFNRRLKYSAVMPRSDAFSWRSLKKLFICFSVYCACRGIVFY